jgi:translation initiation factor 3 subunit G
LTCGQHGNEPEKEEESTKTKLAKAGAGKVVCRLCKGEHFTAKCPHKEALAGLELGVQCLSAVGLILIFKQTRMQA